MAKNTQTRLIAGGCRIRNTEKATWCSGFPKTVVFMGKNTQRLWRIAPDAAQRLYSPGIHVQHGYVGDDTNRMGSFWCISQTSAEAGQWHQISWENIHQYCVWKMRVRPNELVCHQSSLGPVWQLAGRGGHVPATIDNDLHGVGKRLRNKRNLPHLGHIIRHSTSQIQLIEGKI